MLHFQHFEKFIHRISWGFWTCFAKASEKIAKAFFDHFQLGVDLQVGLELQLTLSFCRVQGSTICSLRRLRGSSTTLERSSTGMRTVSKRPTPWFCAHPSFFFWKALPEKKISKNNCYVFVFEINLHSSWRVWRPSSRENAGLQTVPLKVSLRFL